MTEIGRVTIGWNSCRGPEGIGTSVRLEAMGERCAPGSNKAHDVHSRVFNGKSGLSRIEGPRGCRYDATATHVADDVSSRLCCAATPALPTVDPTWDHSEEDFDSTGLCHADASKPVVLSWLHTPFPEVMEFGRKPFRLDDVSYSMQ